MKWGRVLIFISAVLVLVLSGCGPQYEGDAKNDFRSANWGMSRAKVAKTESVEYTYASDEILLFEIEEYDDKMQVFYYFSEDKLISGECRVLMGDHLSNALANDMIESYSRFRDRIIELYGVPLDDDYKVWLDDKGDPADRDAYNIYFGHLAYLTEWDAERTEMSLVFNYDNELINYIFTAKLKSG